MHRLDPNEYLRRRTRILDAMPEGSALLVPTNPERNRSNDTDYRFRPASDFYYLCGFPEPNAWALLRKSLEGPSFVLFVQPKDPEREVWTGIRSGVTGAVERYGADEAHSVEEISSKLGPLIETAERLFFSFGHQPEHEPQITEVLRKLRRGRKGALGPSAIEDAAAFLAEFRLFKTEAEAQKAEDKAREATKIAGLNIQEKGPVGAREL